MKKLLMLLPMLLAAWSLKAADIPWWAGRYEMPIYAEGSEGENQIATAVLILIPESAESAIFNLTVRGKEGIFQLYDTDNQGIPVVDDCIRYNFPEEDFDYSLIVRLNPSPSEYAYQEGRCVEVRCESNIEGNPYGDGVDPAGFYRWNPHYFVDTHGYMFYRGPKDVTCELARGGIYEGKVTLPERVFDREGHLVYVSGIASDAFMDSRLVNEVEITNPEQRVGPGAYNFTSIPYSWEAMNKPRFAYPNAEKRRFVTPLYAESTYDEKPHQWIVFKQNVAPAMLTKDTHKDENLKCGRADFDFENVEGVYYETLIDKKETAKMFKGYEAYEIEALVADQDFVAFHTFPSYSRWKYPEAEQKANSRVVSQVARMYGREAEYSRRAAWLRDGTAELDIVEFKHQDGEAMVVFVWTGRGEIYATCSLTTELEPGFEDFSVWNVDDDGHYGIPDIVSIALDPDGRVNIFVAKNSPESVTCYILHQEGDKLEMIDADQWYRFID